MKRTLQRVSWALMAMQLQNMSRQVMQVDFKLLLSFLLFISGIENFHSSLIIYSFFPGHLTTMSDVYSFGVVLLELLTGRRSVDESRHGREQNLVEWSKPFLKDSHKLDRVMDPGLEGQYSTEGARKAAALTHQCLNHNPKCRPTMSTVVKTLEPLMDLNDIPIGPFVYVVPTEEKKKVPAYKIEREGQAECEVVKNGENGEEKEVEVKAKGRHRSRKGHRYRNRIKSLRSGTVYSDTALYRILGTGLYSPK